ncbi:class I adenylate-forming enzyme family protein [Streptomyces sp. NPDC102360]|uniref:class I adenylate-forming enzyme family protein n=1 Tax=Streptomyces sp. NPDC102360 TaxID=3366160 RepID=UPI00380D0E67
MSREYLPWLRPRSYDDRPCVSDEHEQLTYAQFEERVTAVAEHFAECGVRAASVVAVMLPNRVELLISLVAAWRLGAVATPVNPVFTANEADYQIADSGAVLVINSGPDAPDGGRRAIAVDELRRTPEGAELPPVPADVDALALLVYTSGSTGRPKGVMLSHANIDAMAASMVTTVRLTGDDHCLLVLPLFHVNAICVSFLAPLSVGARLSVLARFQPEPFLKAVAELRPTYFSAVPTIYTHLVSLPKEVAYDTSSLRLAICGAAPASEQLLAAVRDRFGVDVIEGYGLTEGTCASATTPLDGPRKPGTVGVAMPGQRIAIMGPGGELVPAGERGEIVIQGPTVMRGYLNRPEETERTLAGGWLHTGDVGVLDEDGHLSIVDRIKDMIIRGGENLYPKEIEAALHTHPQVLEAAVVGEPHETYGEVPVAYVTAAPGAEPTSDQLRSHCAELLTKVKIPMAVHVMDALPRNPVGKIDKPVLRAAARRAVPAQRP